MFPLISLSVHDVGGGCLQEWVFQFNTELCVYRQLSSISQSSLRNKDFIVCPFKNSYKTGRNLLFEMICSPIVPNHIN